MFLLSKGHLFDLNALTQDGGYTVYHSTDVRRMYRLNVCGPIKNSGCATDAGAALKIPLLYFPQPFITDVFVCTAGVCIKDANTAVNGGMSSKKLVYKDQVLELVYEGGDICAANPSLKHKSIISFICKSEGGDTSKPVLAYSDENTCTHFFSWHTSRVCEEQVQQDAGVNETQ